MLSTPLAIMPAGAGAVASGRKLRVAHACVASTYDDLPRRRRSPSRFGPGCALTASHSRHRRVILW
jgi:hypothetical protein